MRQTKSGPGLGKRAFLGVLAAAALVPPAWAYINGGDYHDTLKTFEKRLKANGWGVSFSAALSADRDAVNQLVGRALEALPEKDAGKIPVETKREVARLTREAIQLAASNNQQTTKEPGPLRRPEDRGREGADSVTTHRLRPLRARTDEDFRERGNSITSDPGVRHR